MGRHPIKRVRASEFWTCCAHRQSAQRARFSAVCTNPATKRARCLWQAFDKIPGGTALLDGMARFEIERKAPDSIQCRKITGSYFMFLLRRHTIVREVATSCRAK